MDLTDGGWQRHGIWESVAARFVGAATYEAYSRACNTAMFVAPAATKGEKGGRSRRGGERDRSRSPPAKRTVVSSVGHSRGGSRREASPLPGPRSGGRGSEQRRRSPSPQRVPAPRVTPVAPPPVASAGSSGGGGGQFLCLNHALFLFKAERNGGTVWADCRNERCSYQHPTVSPSRAAVLEAIQGAPIPASSKERMEAAVGRVPL